MRLSALSLSLLAISPTASAQAVEPLTHLLAAYPYAQHRCVTVTPDDHRAFVGRGAAISILDVTTLPAVTDLAAIQEVEVPDAAPQALAYFRHPTAEPGSMVQRRWLFIAGGTLGLWRINLCEGLFQTVPVTCGESTFQRTMIDRPGSPSTWQWKRCVDVALVEGNVAAGRPLLFALHAANSNYPESTIGPTELRCYKLEPNGATSLYAQVELPSDGPGGIDAVGTALESDPGDPNSVYVALGTAWLWKVTIGAGTLTPSQVPTPAAISLCSLATCTDGESMTDIDLVRVPAAGAVVYASLEYGRVLEYRLTPALVKEVSVQCDGPDPDAFLDRIAAVSASNSSVLIAVVALNAPSRWTQSRAPFLPDGLWSDICINTGIGNVDPVPESSCLDIRFLWSNATAAQAPFQLPLERVLYEAHWGGLVLTHQLGLDFRLYASSGEGATSVFRISDFPCGAMAPPIEQLPCFVELLATWRGPAFAPADGTISLLNPGLTFHGQDGFGPYDGVGELQLLPVSGGSGIDFFPVQQALSACPGSTNPPPQLCSGFKAGSKNPFVGSPPGSATWRDPKAPDLEWFMPGGLTARPVQNCADVPNNMCDVADPCTSNPLVRWNSNGLFPGGTAPDVGWSLVRLHPNPPAGQPATGVTLQPRWWQVNSPHEAPSHRSETVPYVFSVSDPRLVDPDPFDPNDFPIPQFVFLLRGGSDYGLKLMDPAELMSRGEQTCALPERRGRGENLAPNPNNQPAFAEAFTHVDFEDPGSGPLQDPCAIIVSCAGGVPQAPSFVRNLHNNKAHIFSVRNPENEEVWIAAVAAGFIASGPDLPPLHTQTPSCQWVNEYGRALVTFYDLTDVALGPTGGRPPRLIRVGLGPCLAPCAGQTGCACLQSHAFAIRTKSTGAGSEDPVYAYVADLTGRLLTYDVSWSQLFLPTPPAQGEPYRPIQGAPGSHHPHLEPIAVFEFPTSPYDGMRPNCVDIEIDGEDAYCALARAGIGIFDLSNPANPVLHTILDTPGVTQGIVFRPNGLNDVQMVVGDSRAGMRLYGRPPGGSLGGDGDDSGSGGEGGGE